MIIVGCSNSKSLAKKIGEKLNFNYEELSKTQDSSGETHIRFKHSPKNKTTVLVQSFYPNPNEALLETLLAASHARDLQAKKVILVAPYLAYLKEDTRKEKGECINANLIGDIISRNFNELITIDSNIFNLQKHFSIPVHNITSSGLIKDYIKKAHSNVIVAGPDENSKRIVSQISPNSITLNKKSKKNKITISHNFDLENKEAILIDDIIHTGTTMKESIKSLNLKKINIITIHPTFNQETLSDLENYAHSIISCNTISNRTNKIDVSKIIAKKLMQL